MDGVSRLFQATGSFFSFFFFFLIPKMRFSNLSLAFCFMIQDGEKRLLAFTKRGTAIHSVSCQLSFFYFSLYLYVFVMCIVSLHYSKIYLWCESLNTSVRVPKWHVDFLIETWLELWTTFMGWSLVHWHWGYGS